ncbi:hypothetical protein JOC77_000914 [Peribacillus deserti]|uniref:Uncharacterized protein n=1 Tax=Peribacillus deserti TaxID=673318 RepID=A0ABS2QEE2_9BACI|nr:hypothetical protein [Peribacillus deserti]
MLLLLKLEGYGTFRNKKTIHCMLPVYRFFVNSVEGYFFLMLQGDPLA